MKKRVGIFGGSFDPIHFGHLNLAINILEACQLDRVFFCPTSLSPFKQASPPLAPIHHRLEMLKMAIDPIDAFEILDWEAKGAGPFYTINTVRKLSQDTTLELHLLIGEDHLFSFHQWKDVEELIQLAPPIIASRTINLTATLPFFSSRAIEKIMKGMVKIPLYDISSTRVRERLNQKKYCGHLVPSSVLDYIQQHRLY